jgi:hypothetical protein
MLLKGSKSKQVEQWMQDLTALEGQKLHGAGSNRSEDWWKGLGNMLMGQGLLASKSKSVRRAFWGSMLHGHFRQTTMALPTRVEPGEPHKL